MGPRPPPAPSLPPSDVEEGLSASLDGSRPRLASARLRVGVGCALGDGAALHDSRAAGAPDLGP